MPVQNGGAVVAAGRGRKRYPAPEITQLQAKREPPRPKAIGQTAERGQDAWATDLATARQHLVAGKSRNDLRFQLALRLAGCENVEFGLCSAGDSPFG